MTYATIDQVRRYLDNPNASGDLLIEECIDRSQATIESGTQRIFEMPTDTTRKFTLDAVQDELFVAGRTLYNVLLLDADLCQLTSIQNGDGAVIDLANIITNPINATPWSGLCLYDDYWQDDLPGGMIEITGRWAYSITPPHDIVQACIRLATYYHAQKDAQVFDTTAIFEGGVMTIPQGLPRGVYDTIVRYRRHSV